MTAGWKSRNVQVKKERDADIDQVWRLEEWHGLVQWLGDHFQDIHDLWWWSFDIFSFEFMLNKPQQDPTSINSLSPGPGKDLGSMIWRDQYFQDIHDL